MANRKTSIWLYCKTGKGWRYCRAAAGKNGKLRPGWAHVNSHVEHHPYANYYVQYIEGGKQVWKKIGTNQMAAVRYADMHETWMKAQRLGLQVKNEDNELPLMVSHTLDGFLEEYRLSQRPESYALMKQTLYEWRDWNRKNIIQQITRIDLLNYKQWLMTPHPRIVGGKRRTYSCSARTAGNKMMRVQQYLRKVLGQKPGEGLVTMRDARWVETEPTVYGQTDLDKFFQKCSTFQLAVFKTLLMSGLRKQELESLTWNDVDLDTSTVRIAAKAGFAPKTWEERVIEIPAELVAILRDLPRKSQWVFANGGGNRYTHMWDDCVAIAKKAGVKGFHPHGFRRTYATRLLSGGMDLKTVQRLCGWKTLEAAMRYLARAESQTVKAKVDSIFSRKEGAVKSATAEK